MRRIKSYKPAVLLLVCLCLLSGTKAQGGIFNQNQQMTKNLIIQIGLFQTYIGYLKKGYDIVNKGVGLVRDLKNGEFSLHKDYFSSLKTVNPKIKHYSRVATIIAMQLSIADQYRSCFTHAKASSLFSSKELDYLASVYRNLLLETSKSLDELSLIITSGELEMRDDERIRRLDRLYEDMVDKYAFLQHFNGTVKSLAWQRANELGEIRFSEALLNK